MILWKHRQNFITSFISPKLLSVSYEVQHSFSTFGVARNDLGSTHLISICLVWEWQFDSNVGTSWFSPDLT